MSAFSPQLLAEDLAQLQQILVDFFTAVPATAWDRKTEQRATGWTLQQTLAHITMVAEVWYGAMDAVLAGAVPSYPGLVRRSDLPHYIQNGIVARRHLSPQTLIDTFCKQLAQTATQTKSLTAAQLALSVPLPAYNRPLTLAELVGFQLVHPGIVHAAQMANAVGVKPLWHAYPPALMQRQLTRFFHQFSHSYWPERGGDLRAAINFVVAGAGGGRWYVTMDPDGGTVGIGGVKQPSFTLWARHADALCRAFTLQTSPVGAILRGQILAIGRKPWLGFRLPYLFTPT